MAENVKTEEAGEKVFSNLEILYLMPRSISYEAQTAEKSQFFSLL